MTNSATFWQRMRLLMQSIPKSILLGGFTSCLALAVYLITIAPDITWANYGSDGGELITASMTMGIAHPPGYPTYVLLGRLFGLLPLRTIAFRFNLFSAVAMATAAAFSTATAFTIIPTRKFAWAAALAAGLALAFSPLVWSQATVAEVYALNLAVLSIFLWLLLTRRSSWITGTMLGLAVTTHLTSLLMLPLGLALTPKEKKSQLALGLPLGLLPLLILPLLSQLGSPVIWGEPTTLKGWWWLISAQLYRANIDLPDSVQAILFHVSQRSAAVLSQFAWIGWLFMILGVLKNELGRHRSRWLLASAALYVVFSFVYNPNDAILNILPALLLLAPFLAIGLTRVKYWSLLLPLLLLVLNYQAQNLRDEQQVRLLVDRALQELPENTIILTPGDQSIFSLWYFQHVEGRRPDLILVDENMLAFRWYRERLAVRYPKLEGLITDNVELFRELNLQNRSLCDLTLQTPESVSCQSAVNNALKPTR